MLSHQILLKLIWYSTKVNSSSKKYIKTVAVLNKKKIPILTSQKIFDEFQSNFVWHHKSYDEDIPIKFALPFILLFYLIYFTIPLAL